MKHNLEVSADARRTQYFQVFLMGVSAFIMNTTEFVPVALLSDIAQDFAITTAIAKSCATVSYTHLTLPTILRV